MKKQQAGYRQQESIEFAELRKKYKAQLLGDENNPLPILGMREYVKRLDRKTEDLTRQLKENLDHAEPFFFEDLPLCPEENYCGDFREHPCYGYTEALGKTAVRLRELALCNKTLGCALYQDQQVKEVIPAALERFLDIYYTGKFSEKSGGNWYQWVITVPDALLSLCVALYDELPQQLVQRCAEICRHYVPDCMARGPHSNDPEMTGGNLLLKANSTLLTGILCRDETLLENVRQGVKSVLVYNKSEQFYNGCADGFFRDGSYIQHQALAYIGGYGTDLYQNLALFLRVLQGSRWDVRYEDKREKVALDTVFTGIEPFLYKDRVMDMVSGRMIVRSEQSDRARLGTVLNALLPLRGMFTEKEDNIRFDRMMRAYLEQDPERFFSQMKNICSIQIAADILSDPSIRPREDVQLTKVFTMDKAVHLRKKFGLAVSMHSARTDGHELINSEGKRTWNIADGMMYLYDQDVRQFEDGFWAAVDPTRLPGITAEHIDLGEGNGDRSKNIYEWTGGAVLEKEGFGAVGCHLCTLALADRLVVRDPPRNRRVRTGADVKKSWFFLEDQVAVLCAGIRSRTGNRVETIVGNRKVSSENVELFADGKKLELPLEHAHSGQASPNCGQLISTKALTLRDESGSVISWVFPKKREVRILKEERTGDWSHQGTSNGIVQAIFVTILFDHGVNPEEESGVYFLLPGADETQAEAFAENQEIQILKNDEQASAVYQAKSGFTGINFWEGGTVAGISVNEPASVLLQKQGNQLTIAASDPTQRGKQLRIGLPNSSVQLMKADSNMELKMQDGMPVICVDTCDLEGRTSCAVLMLK